MVFIQEDLKFLLLRMAPKLWAPQWMMF